VLYHGWIERPFKDDSNIFITLPGNRTPPALQPFDVQANTRILAEIAARNDPAAAYRQIDEGALYRACLKRSKLRAAQCRQAAVTSLFMRLNACVGHNAGHRCDGLAQHPEQTVNAATGIGGLRSDFFAHETNLNDT
jgi:hypothetical protein